MLVDLLPPSGLPASMTIAADHAKVAKCLLVIHGGLAGPRENLSAERECAVRESLRDSLLAGFEVLQSQAAGSIQAVMAAVCVMEDSPHFNAGKGSIFSRAGTIELDAAIMDGKDRRAGAVAAVKRIRNPVLAANAVMTRATAVFLVGEQADQFAADAGLEMVDPEYFCSERRWNEFQAWREKQSRQSGITPAAVGGEISKGTVGALALDRQGNLAAATSSGGVSFKLPGRVGDSAVIGAGTFADNRSCAVSATGDGELFIRSSAAYSVSARMMYRQQSLAKSAQEAVDDIRNLGGQGGLIAIDKHGNLAMPYHAKGMFRGSINESGDVHVALYEN